MARVETDFDALIVGAGYGGIYQLYRLREMGLSAKVIDMASDVGGTWYWNRYPGAMSDTESFVYRFSWDKEDLQTYPWTHHYVKQPDVLAYLEHVVERHNLRKDMQFNTELLSAIWNDDAKYWQVELSTGESLKVRYLVTALGLLSKANYPDIPGIDTFQGLKVHTAKWPQGLDLSGKRVGIIGCGSTGVQVITDIAPRVKFLTCFQRHPQYSVPSGDRPVDPAYRQWVNENYDAIFDQVRNSAVGFGFVESTIPYKSVASAEEREAIFQSLWDAGNGFRFMFGGFNDITTDREANEAACAFIRKKIREIVKDPEKARKLQPHDYYARRPLCDGGYFEQFNRDNVDVVHLQETPITRITEKGVQTCDKLYELDVLIFATGFDAIEGNYNRIRIRGRGGLTLKDYWDPTGPTSYLGVSVPHFPNLLMITGPQGPFTNLPPALEAHVDLISRLIGRAESLCKASLDSAATPPVVEVTPEAEKEWCLECERIAEGSLFKETASWIFGQNVPGKKYALRFFFGGLKAFYDNVQRVIDNDYAGFKGLGQRADEDDANGKPAAAVEAKSVTARL
ncbi:cyclohexanone monooxygenase [Cladophialophora psammophila CBS 110553]|uniref:Cyclohexanone monooxygenase n=1 Tax=Cladophialophora psammophila CBS 110553 TaxID=1182543 RepID=W9WZ25_9EURO|nr:cyclohexanone monooxygenase [Cladophialophora psammophila CBS 110553]EXJ63494.1 cyclohexanone monooxygenase [Cladophialophora psammophila CBS 110553]